MKVFFQDFDINQNYHAKLDEIIEKDGKFGNFLVFVFTIVDGELKNYRFSGYIKPTNLKKSKFYNWITILLGKEPNTKFDTNDLIGKECYISLIQQNDYYKVAAIIAKKK